jgi:hypothetical protein
MTPVSDFVIRNSFVIRILELVILQLLGRNKFINLPSGS